MSEKLAQSLNTHFVHVEDVSGGCGSMYNVIVVSDDFAGMSLVKQHKMVKGAIAEEIANMHGLRVQTYTVERWELATKQ